MYQKYIVMFVFRLWALTALAQNNDNWKPSNMVTTIEYDAPDNSHVKITKVGDMVVKREYITFQEYQDWQMDELMKKYWHDKVATANTTDGDNNSLLSKIPGFNEIR